MKSELSIMQNPSSIDKAKQYIEVPLRMDCGGIRKRWLKLCGFLLAPFYLVLARILKTPGINIHVRCVFIAIRLLLTGRISLKTAYALIHFPMESTRYFEFHEVLKRLSNVSFQRYLDVSSPYIAPVLLLMQNKNARADLLNPDNKDLQKTQKMAASLNLANRCTFINSTIEAANYPPRTFDLITCISVLEHIPGDSEAVKLMWSLLSPGGRLILTLPCMARPLEQYISRNDYGVLPPGPDGYTFWQRYYDQERLESLIFNITGPPCKMIIYGEKRYGLFYRNATMKRLLGRKYPYWREPYMMATEYRYFDSFAELPGEGVVMLEFVKQ